MYIVYILKSKKDGRTYAGYTSNITRRLNEHNAGRVNATKHRRPFQILKTEQFETEIDAKIRELWWKSASGRSEMKKLFENLN